MQVMAKKEPKKNQKDFPSRKNIKYVGIPKQMYDLVREWGKSQDRSAHWVARTAIREFLEKLGLWPPKAS